MERFEAGKHVLLFGISPRYFLCVGGVVESVIAFLSQHSQIYLAKDSPRRLTPQALIAVCYLDLLDEHKSITSKR